MAPLISILIVIGFLIGGLSSGRGHKGNPSTRSNRPTQIVVAPEPTYAYGAALTGLMLLVRWMQRTEKKK